MVEIWCHYHTNSILSPSPHPHSPHLHPPHPVVWSWRVWEWDSSSQQLQYRFLWALLPQHVHHWGSCRRQHWPWRWRNLWVREGRRVWGEGKCLLYTILAFVRLLCRSVDACLWLLCNDIHGPCNNIHMLSHTLEEVMIRSTNGIQRSWVSESVYIPSWSNTPLTSDISFGTDPTTKMVTLS